MKDLRGLRWASLRNPTPKKSARDFLGTLPGPPAPGFGLPPSARVRARADYLRIQARGRKARGRLIILLACENGLDMSRFGLTVSRRIGNAVLRNRVRRRLREIQRLHRSEVVPGQDVVAVALPGSARAPYSRMQSEYMVLAASLGILEKEGGR